MPLLQIAKEATLARLILLKQVHALPNQL